MILRVGLRSARCVRQIVFMVQKQPASRTAYTLYLTEQRNRVPEHIHIATFDASEADSYNNENCQQAQTLFQQQPGAMTSNSGAKRDCTVDSEPSIGEFMSQLVQSVWYLSLWLVLEGVRCHRRCSLGRRPAAKISLCSALLRSSRLQQPPLRSRATDRS